MTAGLLLALIAADWTGYGGPSGDFAVNTDVSGKSASLAWSIDVGDGRASAAVAGGVAFVPFATAREGKDAREFCDEGLLAVRLSDGAELWRVAEPVDRLEGQQNFSGAPMSPQATPAVVGDLVVSLGFTGRLVARDRATGKEAWRVDLVERFGAEPVQFGYSGSPVVDGNRLVVQAGGEGGTVCLTAAGETVWTAATGEASYATPVKCKVAGVPQWVVAGKDTVFGLDASDGAVLWTHDWKEPGLTNVPTPLPLVGDRLVVSGQGCQGTQTLAVSQEGGDWSVSAGEVPKLQLFYCNAVRSGDSVVSSDGSLIWQTASDGGRLARYRGWPDANLLRVGDEVLVVGGDGRLGRVPATEGDAKLADPGKGVRVVDDRVWAAPTFADGRLLVRGQTTLSCVAFDGSGDPLTAAGDVDDRGEMQKAESQTVSQITKAFEDDGPAAALKLYLAKEAAGEVTNADRRRLIELAESVNRPEFVKLIESNMKPE